MFISQSLSVRRADGTILRSPAEQQAASEGASRSAAVTLDLSQNAVERAKEAMRAAAERQATVPVTAPTTPTVTPEPRPSPSAQVLDPERVHREEMKALLRTHTGAQLYVIRRTIEEIQSAENSSSVDTVEVSPEAQALARREAIRVVRSEQAREAATDETIGSEAPVVPRERPSTVTRSVPPPPPEDPG